MSRTTRKRITYNYESDTYELDRNARDNKGRCDCCGNTWQKRYNKQERHNARMAILNEEDPAFERVRANWH